METAQARGINAVLQSGWQGLADHFVDVNKMIEFGSGILLTFLITELQKYAEA